MLSKRLSIISASWIGGMALSFALLQTSYVHAQMPSPSTISVSGISQIKAQPLSTRAASTTLPVVLFVNVQDSSTESNRSEAIKTLQEKTRVVRRAIEQVGVPAASIQDRSYTVSPLFGLPPEFRNAPLPPSPASPDSATAQKPPSETSPSSQRLILNQSLEVRTSSERKDAIMQAAIRAGANTATVTSTGYQGTTSQPDLPDTTAFVNAVKQATEQAQASAQASAQSAGVKLGGIRSLTVQSPSVSYSSPEGAFWRVQVNIVYNVAP